MRLPGSRALDGLCAGKWILFGTGVIWKSLEDMSMTIKWTYLGWMRLGKYSGPSRDKG